MPSKAVSHWVRIWLSVMLSQCRYHALQEADGWFLLGGLVLAMIHSVRTTGRSDSLEFSHKSWLTFSLFRRFTEISLKPGPWVFEEHLALFWSQGCSVSQVNHGEAFFTSLLLPENCTQLQQQEWELHPWTYWYTGPEGAETERRAAETHLERLLWVYLQSDYGPCAEICSIGHASRVQTLQAWEIIFLFACSKFISGILVSLEGNASLPRLFTFVLHSYLKWMLAIFWSGVNSCNS